MPEALDLMDVAFGKVADDGDLLLDEEFMMGIFEHSCQLKHHSFSGLYYLHV